MTTDNNHNHKLTNKQSLAELIDSAILVSDYTSNPTLHRLWQLGVLKELLAYSAQDQWEVRQHLEQLRDRRNPKGSD